MFQRQKTAIRIIIVFILCLATLSYIVVTSKNLLAQPNNQHQPSAYGYYTGDKVPGDPENEVKIMKQIYQFVQIYRQRNDGKYPTKKNGTGSFYYDITENLLSYGLKDINAFKQVFVNLDNQYVDDPFVRKNPDKYVLTLFPSLRPDGSALGTPTPKGSLDLLSRTSIYYHENTVFPGESRKIANPVGFYMVLWDDGKIERVAYDQVLYMPISSTMGQGYTVVYPEQAGVPWDCLTYEEYKTGSYAHTPMSLPPIGYPLAPGQIEPKPDNGGIESFVQLTRLFGLNIMREPIWDSLGHQVKDFTLQEAANGAAKLKFPLQKKTITLDELQKLHTPAMLYLSDAGRIVTMSTIDDNHAIILDRGMTLIVSRAELAKRYGGEALIAASVNAPSSLEVDQPIRMLNFSSKDAEVTQNVKITNHGAKAISLLIERPLCGITEAKLSQDNLAPGESANLELHFKWRTVLPGDHQSTFVTLKTNDPAQPRLQLGFDLKLAEGVK